jgi:Matrixin
MVSRAAKVTIIGGIRPHFFNITGPFKTSVNSTIIDFNEVFMRSHEKVIYIFAAICTSLLLTACPSDPRPYNSRKKIYVLGNPENIIAGAKLEPEYDLNFFKNTKELQLITITEFEQTEAVEVGRKIDLEKENAATEETQERKNPKVSVHFSDDAKSVKLKFVNTGISFTLTHSADGKPILAAEKISNRNGKAVIVKRQDLQILHFSVSANKNTMSLLYLGEDKKKMKTMGAIYLAKNALKVELPRASKEYFYTLGRGLRYIWDPTKPVELNICGSNIANSLSNEIDASVKKWQQALGNKLQINLSVPREFKPFTDLNQHCIYLTENYLASGNPNYGSFAVTATMIDDSKAHIIDSDIIIFRGEFRKTKLDIFDDRLRKALQYTITHELGHFLGLDHQFTDGVPSIMSYEYKVDGPTRYDTEAIQALYN